MGLADVEVIIILFFRELALFGVSWSIWLAGTGLLVMLLSLVAIPWLGRPQAEELLARTLMQGATLRNRLIKGFRFVAIVPVLTLLPLLAVVSTLTMQEQVVPRVEGLATSIATGIPPLIQGRVTGIESLAGHIMAAGHADEASLRNALLRHHASSQEFASLWIARPTGDVVVATAIKHGKAVPWSGPVAGVAMMDSFKRAVIANELYISPIEKGVAADAAPMMFVSVPVTLNGNSRWGFVQGLLNLRTVVGGLVSQGTDDKVSAVVIDQRNRVILMSPGLVLKPFSDLSGHPLMTAAASEAPGIADPGKAYSFSGLLNNNGDVARYVAVARPLDNGWHIFATATQTKADLTLLIYMALGLIWALFAVMLARGLAPLYGQSVAKPLQKLEESLDGFDVEHTISVIPFPPSDAPQEIRQTYARVRESMRNSRDAYRNMMKAVNEGNELRKSLLDVTGKDADGAPAAVARPDGGKRPSGSADLAMAQEPMMPDTTWVGRLDSVTHLSGLDVFEGFFAEAWTLGISDSRPMSVVLVRIGATDDQTLKLVAQKLKAGVGRTLDLVARIAAWEFAMILPDTDLNGALSVAEKVCNGLQSEMSLQPAALSFGVASIVPIAGGNAQSFLDMCHRALATAHQEGSGQIAFASDKGKITLYSRGDLIDWDLSAEIGA